MEILIMLALLAVLCGQSLLLALLCRGLLGQQNTREPAAPAELPEEREARRAAAEAQRR